MRGGGSGDRRARVGDGWIGDGPTASPGPSGGALLQRHGEFVEALRTCGVRVSVAESLDAASAACEIDFADREQLRAALAASLVKRHLHRPVFDVLFDLYYPPAVGASARPSSTTTPEPRPADAAHRGPLEDPVRDRIRADLAEYLRSGDLQALALAVRDGVDAFGAVRAATLPADRGGSARPGGAAQRSPASGDGRGPGSGSGSGSGAGSGEVWSRLAVLDRVAPDTLRAGVLQAVLDGAVRAGSDDPSDPRSGVELARARTMIEARIREFGHQVGVEVNRRTGEQVGAGRLRSRAARRDIDRIDFLGAARQDVDAIRREIAPLARRLAARLALDRRRAARGRLDHRRTIRRSLGTGGVPVALRHRRPAPARTELVLVCDVSDSVSTFARFTLLLAYAMREQFSRVRAFAFVDELAEVTEAFSPDRDPIQTVAELTRTAPVTGLLGRTDYGRVFTQFHDRHADLVTRRTSLLVLGDARSNYGDLALPEVADLVARAGHAYWLNPERVAAWDTGDSAAGRYGRILPMIECRNLEQLGAFVRDLATR